MVRNDNTIHMIVMWLCWPHGTSEKFLFSNSTEHDRLDNFTFVWEPSGIMFGSKTEGKLSALALRLVKKEMPFPVCSCNRLHDRTIEYPTSYPTGVSNRVAACVSLTSITTRGVAWLVSPAGCDVGYSTVRRVSKFQLGKLYFLNISARNVYVHQDCYV